MSCLQNLNDLELCVHDHDIFSLRFSLSFNHIALRLMSWCGGQQTASSQHHLGHQLPNSVNGLHHITATYNTDRARKHSNLHKGEKNSEMKFYLILGQMLFVDTISP